VFLEGTLVFDELVGEICVEAAVEWLPSRGSTVESYANIERTTDGGTHVQGLIEGLAERGRERLSDHRPADLIEAPRSTRRCA